MGRATDICLCSIAMVTKQKSSGLVRGVESLLDNAPTGNTGDISTGTKRNGPPGFTGSDTAEGMKECLDQWVCRWESESRRSETLGANTENKTLWIHLKDPWKPLKESWNSVHFPEDSARLPEVSGFTPADRSVIGPGTARDVPRSFQALYLVREGNLRRSRFTPQLPTGRGGRGPAPAGDRYVEITHSLWPREG
ncbi:hypothetical protein EYF80_019586 [Liparis tanakae]|uniref:Uncharacterized protein n=1 Tax=Liparis tanakae TaxID=230148 RepID=A0A4Z2HY06_9TELE|nr:hypothetical protein EYF80_019586 [Liparis tanakae]